MLASLPTQDLDMLAPDLRGRRVARDEELLAPSALIASVYFPLSGLISLIAVLTSGQTVEVAALGRDGVVGLPWYPGAQNLSVRATGQITGDGVEIDAARFWEAQARSSTLRVVMARATHAYVAAAAQTAACNSAHEVGQRLCRWLLIARDAAGSDELALTHEYLATMIGAQRPTVTLAARRLQDARVIDYRRGRIRLMDVPALEARSCECYRSVRGEVDRLLRRSVDPAIEPVAAG